MNYLILLASISISCSLMTMEKPEENVSVEISKTPPTKEVDQLAKKRLRKSTSSSEPSPAAVSTRSIEEGNLEKTLQEKRVAHFIVKMYAATCCIGVGAVIVWKIATAN